MPTKDDLQTTGTPMRVKLPGVNGTAGYLVTKTKRAPYHLGSGTLVVRVEGMDAPVPVRDVELVPQAAQDTGVAANASPYRSPFGAGP